VISPGENEQIERCNSKPVADGSRICVAAMDAVVLSKEYADPVRA